jgi:hypothetical protein
MVHVLADPAVRQRIGDLGLEVPDPDRQTSEALGAFQKAEIEKWWPLVTQAYRKPSRSESLVMLAAGLVTVNWCPIGRVRVAAAPGSFGSPRILLGPGLGFNFDVVAKFC